MAGPNGINKSRQDSVNHLTSKVNREFGSQVRGVSLVDRDKHNGIETPKAHPSQANLHKVTSLNELGDQGGPQ